MNPPANVFRSKVFDKTNHILLTAAGNSTLIFKPNSIATLLSLTIQISAADTLQLLDLSGVPLSNPYRIAANSIWSVAPRLVTNNSGIVLKIAGAAIANVEIIWANGNRLDSIYNFKNDFAGVNASSGTIIPNPLPVTGDWLTNAELNSDFPLPVNVTSSVLPTNAAQETGGNLAAILSVLNLLANPVIKTISIGNPAVGSGATFSPPAGKRWTVLSMSFVFVASVQIATRTIAIGINTAGASFFNGVSRSTLTASQVARLNCYPTSESGADVPSLNQYFIGTAPQLIFDSNDVFSINATNIQTGDQFSQIVLKVIEQ